MLSTRRQVSKSPRVMKRRRRRSLKAHSDRSSDLDNQPKSKTRSTNKIRPMNNLKISSVRVIKDHHSNPSKKMHRRSVTPIYSLTLSEVHQQSQVSSELTNASTVTVNNHQTSLPDLNSSVFNDGSTKKIYSSSKQKRSHHDHDQVFNRKNKRNKLCAYFHCCTPLCAILSMLATIFLVTAIVTIPIAILFKNKSSTTSTTTTSTSSTRTTVSSTTSSTTSATSSTISSTSSTSTTTLRTCTFSCLNRTWISSSGRLARWAFEGTFVDDMNTYNATAVNSPTFITTGYVNQALFLNAAASQYLYTSYIPLIGASFTIDLWIYPTGFPSPTHHSILGLCTYPGNDQCLHITVRNSSNTYRLYMSFFGDNCETTGTVPLNKWSHAAFSFDSTTRVMLVYLNGELVGNITSALTLQGSLNNVTIGYIPGIVAAYGTNFFQGYMDQLTISNRVKPPCEILDDATLASYYNFDSNPILTDSGPNSLSSTSVSVDFVSSGHISDAIAFNNSTSYLQIAGFTGLGVSNNPFSISLWIRPYRMLGTIVFVSQTPVGAIWCASFIGFAATGALVAQLWNGAAKSVFSPTNLTSSIWYHVVETWSSTNGLRLYINNFLVASDPATITYAGSSASNYIILANRPNNSCTLGAVGTHGRFFGDIDDFRVYSREITIDDVCALYHN